MKKDLTNQPLTSSIWGRRIKDKPLKELLWLAQEYTCEILVTIATLVMFVLIFVVLSNVPKA